MQILQLWIGSVQLLANVSAALRIHDILEEARRPSVAHSQTSGTPSWRLSLVETDSVCGVEQVLKLEKVSSHLHTFLPLIKKIGRGKIRQ